MGCSYSEVAHIKRKIIQRDVLSAWKNLPRSLKIKTS